MRTLGSWLLYGVVCCASAQAGDPADLSPSDLRAAALKGDVDAQFELGSDYLYGEDGLERDPVQAMEWFRRAAEQGHAWAQESLGRAYQSGEGVAIDLERAVQWWRLAADQGNTSAEFWLGRAYELGEGVAVDAVVAAAWYRRAADAGEAYAQSSLGDLYRDGRGVNPSDTEAVAWYRKAAAQGIGDGQYELAEMISAGRGVAQDDREALRYYRLAAEQGFEAAMLELARFYEDGRGAPKNLLCAYFWLGFAATDWDFAAEELDELAPKLSATELAQARKLIAATTLDEDDNVKRPPCPGE